MRQILYRGTIVGCALALVMSATAWLAPAAMASDSLYWSSYMNGGGIREIVHQRSAVRTPSSARFDPGRPPMG